MFVNRKTAQIISSFFFISGICHFFAGGFEIGAILTGTGFYIMIFSESLLLQKVQSEMAVVLESLRKKQDKEIQSLMDFLRSSKINRAPFDSWDGAKLFLEKAPTPAFLMSPDMTIVKANKKLHDLLGYEKGSLDGQPAARINYIPLMSEAAGKFSKKPYNDLKDMHMRYMYLTKEGKHTKGLLILKKIVDGGFFMLFCPDAEQAINNSELDLLVNPSMTCTS
tara:strand:+ start:468 stop:1136 length:669 start_codon:yes stop_codon:yes gene_type:complete